VIRYGARIIQSLRANPLRALTRYSLLLLVGVVLASAALNLWAWHHVREADRLVDRQHFSKAYTHFTQALWVWRRSAATHFLAARTARRAGLYTEAERHLDECQRLQGDVSGYSLPLALEHLLVQAQSGDIGEVEEVLWGYVNKNKPETPLILEAMARGYVRVLRLGSALLCVRMLLEREPDNIEALLTRAWIRESGGEPEKSSEDYRRALELNPERDDALLGLAKSLVRDQPAEARTYFEQVITRQPDNLDALLGLAQAERIAGEPDKARAALDQLLARDPKNSKALMERGALTLAAGKASEAETLLREAIAADPGNAEAHYQLYLCLEQQPGREEEAAAQRDTHKRVQGDLARLLQIASSEMTRAPNDPNLHQEMGVLYLRYGKPDVGVRWLYRALKLSPAHQASHQALYEYFRRTGQLEKAELHRMQLHASTK
jgi:tetratricopeptide (TPR) repeat protein